MKSKFKLIAYFIPMLFLFFTGLFIHVIMNMKSTFNSVTVGYFVVSLMFLSIVMIFAELRDKVIRIELNKNQFIVTPFCGTLNTKIINNKDITGFYTTIVSTKYGSYDYLYLIKDSKKVAKISNQYHKNFDELSTEVKKKYKDLGFINSGLVSEFKDLFKTNYFT